MDGAFHFGKHLSLGFFWLGWLAIHNLTDAQVRNRLLSDPKGQHADQRRAGRTANSLCRSSGPSNQDNPLASSALGSIHSRIPGTNDSMHFQKREYLHVQRVPLLAVEPVLRVGHNHELVWHSVHVQRIVQSH